MNAYEELIDEQARFFGIVPEYWDIFGNKKIASFETKKAILRAMKVKTESEEDIRCEIENRKLKKWKNIIDPVHVVSENTLPLILSFRLPVNSGKESSLELSLSFKDENGNKTKNKFLWNDLVFLEDKLIDGDRYINVQATDNLKRDIGYYSIDVECSHPDKIFHGNKNKITASSRLIITPDSCYIPSELDGGQMWGMSVNLYSIRSEQNYGVGDFRDLRGIIKLTADMGGGFVGINPLHAIPNTKPYGISPYSPISRLYRNFIYLSISDIFEMKEFNSCRFTLTAEMLEEIDRLKKSDTIDYEKVANLKSKILKSVFNYFYKEHYKKDTACAKEFKQYILNEGKPLETFALYMVLWEDFKETKNIYSWQKWPEEYRDLSSSVVEKIKKKYKKEIIFQQFVQWLIELQLKDVVSWCEKHGMTIGLYNDLAIGSIGSGSDVWCNQDIYGNADVGAPPDDFSPDGQNWGFPPMIPEKMLETGYELFIKTIRKNMQYGGALRIDHALGLFRLFWIPSGLSASDGAYVEYPHEDLLRIVALESVRNKSVVVAEDLGTIGDNVRDALKKFRMLSYRLFYFERNYPDPSFVSPSEYPPMALCSVTTHDLPTLYGYWVGQDIKAKKDLGKYSEENHSARLLEERERDKNLILTALKSQNILPDDFQADAEKINEMTPELCNAIYEYLARTPCKLILVSLDDIIGTLNQQNMPGTVDTYPNWMQKTPISLEMILTDKRFSKLAEMFRRNINA